MAKKPKFNQPQKSGSFCRKMKLPFVIPKTTQTMTCVVTPATDERRILWSDEVKSMTGSAGGVMLS